MPRVLLTDRDVSADAIVISATTMGKPYIVRYSHYRSTHPAS